MKLADASKDICVGQDVVTYVARNLEPYRGFTTFMRSLPRILRERPSAQVLIVGGDEVSYGPQQPPGAKTHRELMLEELAGTFYMSRVHFLGKVPYATFLTILQVSKIHVYLTYPFVLSWFIEPVEEVIRHNENGLLVDFFSADEVATVVCEVLANSPDFNRVHKNARRTIVERFDLQRICLPAHLSLIERVAESR